jgi:hypothetical protein
MKSICINTNPFEIEGESEFHGELVEGVRFTGILYNKPVVYEIADPYFLPVCGKLRVKDGVLNV